MYRSISGKPVYTCISTLWTDDVAHQAESLPDSGFVIVLDPSGIFANRESFFFRDDVSISAYLGSWSEGTIFKDLRDGNWYRVVGYTTNNQKNYRQKLRCIFDTCELVPRSNSGNFKRVQL